MSKKRHRIPQGRITIENAINLLPGKFQAGARAAFSAAEPHIHRNSLHGAALSNGKRIFATGRNRVYKTHPCENSPYSTIHAETDVIRNIIDSKHTQNSTLIVVRITSGLELIASSRPCKFCMKSIRDASIQTILYTTAKGWKIEYV